MIPPHVEPDETKPDPTSVSNKLRSHAEANNSCNHRGQHKSRAVTRANSMAALSGCTMFAPAYMGGERWAPLESFLQALRNACPMVETRGVQRQQIRGNCSPNITSSTRVPPICVFIKTMPG